MGDGNLSCIFLIAWDSVSLLHSTGLSPLSFSPPSYPLSARSQFLRLGQILVVCLLSLCPVRHSSLLVELVWESAGRVKSSHTPVVRPPIEALSVLSQLLLRVVPVSGGRYQTSATSFSAET